MSTKSLKDSGNYKQLLDYQPKPKAEADNTNRDLDYSGYHKNRI